MPSRPQQQLLRELAGGPKKSATVGDESYQAVVRTNRRINSFGKGGGAGTSSRS